MRFMETVESRWLSNGGHHQIFQFEVVLTLFRFAERNHDHCTMTKNVVSDVVLISSYILEWQEASENQITSLVFRLALKGGTFERVTSSDRSMLFGYNQWNKFISFLLPLLLVRRHGCESPIDADWT